MDSKYNKIKEGLGSENNPIPPELAWENMQEGIFKKMDGLNKSRSRKNRILVRTAIIILILLLIQFICTPLSFKKNDQDKESVLYKNRIANNKAKHESGSSEFTADTIALSSKITGEPTLKGKVKSDERKSSNSLSFIQKSRANGQMVQTYDSNIKAAKNESFENSQALDTRSSGKQLSSNNSDVSKELSKNTRHNQVLHNESMALDHQEKDILSIQAMPSIHLLERFDGKLLYISAPNKTPVLDLDSANNDIELENKNYSTNRLSLTGGVSYWSDGYGPNKPQRQAYEKPVASFSSALSYLHRFRNNMEFYVGLQYTQLESRFDYQREIENYTVIIQDTLVQVQNNLVTGKESFVRGNVEVPVSARRIVRHYNRIRMIQIPVAMGYSWGKYSWEFGLYAGASININSSISGRTLMDEEIIDYVDNETAKVSNAWKLGIMSGGRIGYALSDRISLSLNIQYQKSITDWSIEEGVNRRPILFNAMVGFGYTL